jgi:hypothetical protein
VITSASTNTQEHDLAALLYLRFLREAHSPRHPIHLTPDESWLLQEIAIRWLDNKPMSVHEAINLGHLGSPATLHKRVSRLRSLNLLAIGQRETDRRTKYLIATQESLSHFKELGVVMQNIVHFKRDDSPEMPTIRTTS